MGIDVDGLSLVIADQGNSVIGEMATGMAHEIRAVSAARRVVLAGFVVGLVCSFIGTQIIGELGPLVTLRVAIGSGSAFLVAQLIDVLVFDKMRGGTWWRAPLTSSLVGSSVDTLIFFSIAFSGWFIWLEPGNDVSWANEALPLLGLGPVAPLWVSLALADYSVKLAIATIALVPFRLVVSRLVTRLS